MRIGMGCALTITVLSSLACHTTKVVSIDMAPASNPVRLTLSDQSVVVVFGPKIYGNKLVGFVDGKYKELLIAQVMEVRVREPARGRTTALIVASVVGFAAAVYAVAGTGLLQGRSDTMTKDICDEEPDNPVCM